LFPELDIYHSMSYFVSEKLGLRPNDVIDNWYVPELIVTFGMMANKESYTSYKQWEGLSEEQKRETKKPNKHVVIFRTWGDYES